MSNVKKIIYFFVIIALFLHSPAFNKMVSVNGQDFNLQLVDTAGQVSCPCTDLS